MTSPLQAPSINATTQPKHHSTQFAAELPSQWQGGGTLSGPANTQFRHELPEQQIRQSAYFRPPAWRRFAIPTDNDSLSSGFPYQARLHEVGVSQDQWLQFTNEVINAAKLSLSEDAAAWATGAATGTAASPFLLVFAPVVGYYAGKSVHKKTVIKKVKEKLAQDTELRLVLLRWNEGVFRERGMQAWLEPPSETGEVLIDVHPGMKQKDIEKMAKKQGKRFTIVIMPHDPRNPPMGQIFNPTSPVSPQSDGQGQWPTQQTPITPGRGQPVYLNGSWGTQSQHPAPLGPLPLKFSEPQELPDTPPMPTTYELDSNTTVRFSK